MPAQAPLARHYRIARLRWWQELPAGLLERELPLNDRRCISGHFDGGHGALVCALRNPGRYKLLFGISPQSAYPAAAPGREVLQVVYLGPDRTSWMLPGICVRADRLSGPRGCTLLIDRTRRSFPGGSFSCGRRIWKRRLSSGGHH